MIPSTDRNIEKLEQYTAVLAAMPDKIQKLLKRRISLLVPAGTGTKVGELFAEMAPSHEPLITELANLCKMLRQIPSLEEVEAGRNFDMLYQQIMEEFGEPRVTHGIDELGQTRIISIAPECNGDRGPAHVVLKRDGVEVHRFTQTSEAPACVAKFPTQVDIDRINIALYEGMVH